MDPAVLASKAVMRGRVAALILRGDLFTLVQSIFCASSTCNEKVLICNHPNQQDAMASEGLPDSDSSQSPGKAKTYNRIKLFTGVVSSVISFVLMLMLVVFGYSMEAVNVAKSITSNEYVVLVVFALYVGLLQAIVALPLGYYSGFYVEHAYHLSNQSLARWAWERMKGTLVSLPIIVGVLLMLYYCMQVYDRWWWLPVATALTLLSVVLARIAPVLIMPLFYKFTPIEKNSLRERILRLCGNAGLHIAGVFSFNLSKNTRKANAGFTGIGKSKRIILADTLIKDFSEDEIETVFAHELGHYKHRHILIGIVVGIVSTFVGLFAASQLYEWSLPFFGFSEITDIAALPILALWLSVFGLMTSPIGNILSRKHERQADAFAVRTTGNAVSFVSALRKLASTNMADPEPHPLIEFLFYSHPSITKRIKMVETLQA